MVLGTALQTYGEQAEREQEVLMAAADILIDAYARRECGRARSAGADRIGSGALHVAAARVYVNDAADRVEHSRQNGARGYGGRRHAAHAARGASASAEDLARANTIALRRQLADAAVERKSYPF